MTATTPLSPVGQDSPRRHGTHNGYWIYVKLPASEQFFDHIVRRFRLTGLRMVRQASE